MTLQYLLLACLAAAVSAQSGDGGLMPEDPIMLAQENLTIAERYSRMQSVRLRETHFFVSVFELTHTCVLM